MPDLARRLQNGIQAAITVDGSLNESFVSAWETYLWLFLANSGNGGGIPLLKSISISAPVAPSTFMQASRNLSSHQIWLKEQLRLVSMPQRKLKRDGRFQFSWISFTFITFNFFSFLLVFEETRTGWIVFHLDSIMWTGQHYINKPSRMRSSWGFAWGFACTLKSVSSYSVQLMFCCLWMAYCAHSDARGHTGQLSLVQCSIHWLSDAYGGSVAYWCLFVFLH